MAGNADSSDHSSATESQMSGTKALQNAEMSSGSQSQSRLLNLPAEIRNEIYRLCLVKDEEVIQIDEDLKPPALLSTCRQIRQETIEVWCLRNEFEIQLGKCDSSLFQAFMADVLRPLNVDIKFGNNLTIGIDNHHIDWKNLMDWCKSIWSGKMYPIGIDRDVSPAWAIVQMATEIAFHSRKLKWSKVESQLEGLKVVAGQVTDLEVENGEE